jgi:hypothetical protein
MTWLSVPALPKDPTLEQRVENMELRLRRLSRTHWISPWAPIIVAFVTGWFMLQGTKNTVREQGKEAVRQASLDEEERRANAIAIKALEAFEKGHEQRTRQLIHDYLSRNEPMLVRP